MIDQAVLSLISCVAFTTAVTSLFMTAVVLRRMERRVEEIFVSDERLFDLPNGKGGVALSAIAAVVHDVDGFNVWVYLKSGQGAALCLTWAEGVELEQAWREWQKS